MATSLDQLSPFSTLEAQCQALNGLRDCHNGSDRTVSLLPALNLLAQSIHQRNIEAGWWTDLATGGDIRATRNVPEMLMLIVSELSEASMGHADNLMDDKLPHRKMLEVELADALIRMMDLFPVKGFDLAKDVHLAIGWSTYTSAEYANHPRSVQESLMDMVNCVSAAMEGVRKQRMSSFHGKTIFEMELAQLYVAILAFSHQHNLDIGGAVYDKLEYNAHREDHQVANRLKEGGKAF
jgi:hypothetical protein